MRGERDRRLRDSSRSLDEGTIDHSGGNEWLDEYLLDNTIHVEIDGAMCEHLECL